MNRKLITKALSVLVALCVTAPIYADPPAQSGPHVYRYQDNTWFWFADADAGLTVFLGIPDIVAACNGEEWLPEEVDIMDVITEEEPARIVSRLRGDLTVTVWETVGIDCAKFTSELPLAYGTVTLFLNDNDVLAWQENERNNKNAYTWKANGVVWESLTGEPMRLNLVAHFLWGGYNNPAFKEKGFININLN